ncbi:MAG: branched-chain amino acid ABC transporter substrate-binding protein [Gemmatimonadetes bacterium]|nr:branched-chain amino acid ABC transporter substrate-binding protein [Gemmatimonadota bacterium]
MKHIRIIVVITLAAGLMWNCGGERVTQSETGTDEQIGRPLSKLAVHEDVVQATIGVTVHRDGAPVSGATVEFSRSIAGQAPDYKWSGMTNDNGQAWVEITSGNGYYQARASQDGVEIGSWSSIPINAGYQVMLNLPIGGQAQVTGSSMRALVSIGEGEAVQIRSLLSHTVVPGLAEGSLYAIELAVQDFGMIHGHAVELGESLDTGCGPEGGRMGAEQIIANPQVVGVIGTNCSGAAVAASPVISEAGLVMISPSNTSPALTSDLAGNVSPNYHPGYFRTSNNDLYEANAVADFAYNELGLRRLVAIDDGDPYTMGLTVAFGNAFSALGGEVAATTTIAKGQTDMTSVLTEFAAATPDGIYFPLFDLEGAPFAEQVRGHDSLKDATLITSSALLLTGFLALPQSEGIYFAGPEPVIGSNVNAATGKSVDEVLAAFATTYGESPNTPYWAHAYDATTLLLNAIEIIAGEAEGKLYVDRAALRRQLHATSGFQGLLGTLNCDEFGDCGTGRVNIYHHTDLNITDPAQLPIVYQFSP